MNDHPTNQAIDVFVPLKVGAGLNDRLHWRARGAKVKRERTQAFAVLARITKPFPAVITLTRVSAGALDDDNLQGAMKAVRDGVADAFHLADNHPGLSWRYAQEKCKHGQFGVRIRIEVRPSHAA